MPALTNSYRITRKAGSMVDRMAAQMAAEMSANNFKGDDWDANMSAAQHEFELIYHALKLIYSARAGDLAGVREHAADTANQAGMLAYATNALDVIASGNTAAYAEGTSGVRELASHFIEILPNVFPTHD